MRQAMMTGALIIVFVMGTATNAHAKTEDKNTEFQLRTAIGYTNYDQNTQDGEDGLKYGVQGKLITHDDSKTFFGVGINLLFDSVRTEECIGRACGTSKSLAVFHGYGTIGAKITNTERIYLNIGYGLGFVNYEINVGGLSDDTNVTHGGIHVSGGIETDIEGGFIFFEGGITKTSDETFTIANTRFESEAITETFVIGGIGTRF